MVKLKIKLAIPTGRENATELKFNCNYSARNVENTPVIPRTKHRDYKPASPLLGEYRNTLIERGDSPENRD